MSRKNSNRRYTKSQIEARIAAKRKAKRLAMQKHLAIFSLFVILLIGLVSTSFASFITPAQTGESGSLIAQITTNAVKQGNKDHIADTKANVDVAETSAETIELRYQANMPSGNYNASSAKSLTQSTNNSNRYYCTLSLSANTSYGFFIKWGNNYYKASATATSDNSVLLYNYGSNNYGGSNHRVTYKTGTAGNYIFTFDTSNNKIVVSPETQTIKLAYDVASGHDSWYDLNNKEDFTRHDGHIYTLDLNLNKEKYYMFSIVNNVYWRGTSELKTDVPASVFCYGSDNYGGSGDKVNFTPPSAGTYRFTWNHADKTISVAELTYNVKKSESGGTGTVTLGGKTLTTTNTSMSPGSHALSITAPTGCNVSNVSVTGGTLTTAGTTGSSTYTGTVNVNKDTTVSVTYVSAGYSYTVTAGTGGTASPASGTDTSVEITATPNTGYNFAGWETTNGTVDNASSATTTFTPSANGANANANFRPNAPSELTLTGSNVASGTTGDGTQTKPFIVFENSGFTLTANATVVSGASQYYCATSSGTYSTTNTFTPSLSTKGTSQSYTVYSKAYTGGYYSENYLSATAHYMVFTHLDGGNTGFTKSSDSITDIESITFSNPYVNGVADAENEYITQSYQISTDNANFSDISGSTWTPDTVGTYYFRIKTTNTKTGETVYSTSQYVTVVQSTVYYTVTVVNDGTTAGTVTLKADDVAFTNGQILSNSKLTVSLARPDSNYYIEYLEVDTLTESDNSNVNGNITDYVAYDHVKGNVVIHYKLTEKPKVDVKKPANSASISFKYYVDGVEKTADAAGTYSVDYNSKITYSVTPSTGYYVSAMTGVTMGEISSSTVTGTKSNVTSNITNVTATLTKNNTVKVSVDTTSDVTEGGSMTIDSTAVSFGTPKALNYGAEAEVVITPPDGCYAVVSGNEVEATIGTDGKATFSVMLKGESKEYTVKFVSNPKIYMVQPQYGSVYVTSGSGDNTVYYFNGDSVGYGTELTVHAKVDHSNAKLNNVLVNDASIGTADGSKFKIYENSTATADITVDSKFVFAEGTEYGTRRIFFTDNASWGDGKVSVHPSTTSSDTDITTDSVVMTYKYTNDMSQLVYYADIPFSAKYVTFYNKSNTSQKTNTVAISNANNAFWNDNGTCTAWNMNYSDFVATDRADSIQQATTTKGNAATFQYTCDFGDDTLIAEVVSGNDATFDFDKGTLSITPTSNTQSYTLVKVTSSASTTVKYYLIRVENFELLDFTGLQKIYNSSVFNEVQLDIIVKGGVLNYAAKYFVSDTNAGNSYSEIDGKSSGFSKVDSLEGYINSFLVKYNINTVSGVKYYRIDVTDGANHKTSTIAKTLFGTNTHTGERVLYFYNDTNVNMSKYNLRACFMSADDSNKTFVTMQRVGNSDYYRAVIPKNATGKVNFYLCNPNTFSNNFADYDGVDDTKEFYSFGVMNASIPGDESGNIVYKASTIDSNGIKGDFVDFDY